MCLFVSVFINKMEVRAGGIFMYWFGVIFKEYRHENDKRLHFTLSMFLLQGNFTQTMQIYRFYIMTWDRIRTNPVMSTSFRLFHYIMLMLPIKKCITVMSLVYIPVVYSKPSP